MPALADQGMPIKSGQFTSFPVAKQQGIWHESPFVSKVIDQLVIKNWTSLNNADDIEWTNQITNLALNLASKEISEYATKSFKKIPFVLTASINVDIRSEGTTNIGGDALFKIADFGRKEDNTRDGLAFLHTKYTGNVSNGSTWNAGLGLRHLIGDDLLAGVNGYWDYRTTDYSTSYSRFGVGAELFWNSLSLRNNWYIAGTGKETVKVYNTEYYERVVPGWDVELGYRLPSHPNVAFFVRGFRWDYQQSNDNSGLQGTVAYQISPHMRIDSWVSNEIPANPTLSNRELDDRQDLVFGLNFTLTANAVRYEPNNTQQMLQQEMISPVRRRYDILLERWKKSLNEKGETTKNSFTNTVGGA
ncbi:inverse autotransporter beta domain-containing protein [Synechococcus sp. UW105]|uniref:inverse autotransporter beta domain-containing protein n=1 Tax=Synechococcus sp. UW105 TaxID=337067 RepID=UPI0014820CBF|nr:inverse autotransporter beta domain-containing protein [Synechococcus sp. UW105]